MRERGVGDGAARRAGSPGRSVTRCWILFVCTLSLVGASAGSALGSTDIPRAPVARDSPALTVRREYNQTAAAIDTIVRIFGHQQLARMADAERVAVELPKGVKAVLLYWADDEVELFLNGNPISRARLTATRVEIPAHYLEVDNELLAHVWDTDRVESGFMCGLYLEDEGGQLRPVLTSGEAEWETQQGTQAQEIFYAHPQPDIPEAHVIWGDQLFGEVWLKTRFSGESLRRALSRSPFPASHPDQKWQRASMEFDNALSRLALLQERRAALGRILKESSTPRDLFVRFSALPGQPSSRRAALAFTLGQAHPLAHEATVETTPQLQRWARSLPPQAKELIFREARELKGWSQATEAVQFGDTDRGEEDRRADYRPPPERGPRPEGALSRRSEGGGEGSRRAISRNPTTPWALLAFVCLYFGGVCLQWWRVFHRPDWLT